MPKPSPYPLLAKSEYHAACSAELKRRFGVTAADVGLAEDDTDRHRADTTPADFVAWFGEKYDLDEVGGW